jgi:hypothetical protein
MLICGKSLRIRSSADALRQAALPAKPCMFIIGHAGKASCLRARLSSNVRRRNQHLLPMNVSEFLAKTGFRSHGTVVNSWDAFKPDGTVLMQLWQAPGQRKKDHKNQDVYLRVECLNAAHFAENKQRQAVGYAGRLRAIKAIESGTQGYAALSAPPSDKHGPGLWAKHSDLSRVYPIIGIEHDQDGNAFALLGKPVATDAIGNN